MSERDGYEPGVPCRVTAMHPDPAAAARFYGDLFGWQMEADDQYFVARLRGREAALLAPLPPGIDPPPPAGWVTHVWTDSADATADRARRAGGSVIAGPADWPTGRAAVIADPSGAALTAWQPDRSTGAQVVNEPSAWAMSRLDTPDPERAEAFYREMFNWTSESFDAGEISVTLFRLPGYVGGEPEQPVSREVVAAMAAIAPGQAAGWSVDFWVDDVDARTAALSSLGGSVVQAPSASPTGRTAVLADPWGASFSISRVSP